MRNNMSASGEILILFGSETGNAEELAFEAGSMASNYELQATVKGMDEFAKWLTKRQRTYAELIQEIMRINIEVLKDLIPIS